MDTLDRFLLREFAQYFIIILVALACLFLGIDFLSNFWDMQTRLPMTKILAVYGYRMPAALQLFFPVACLMATLLVLTQMSRHNEILALYATGTGSLRIGSTLLAGVCVVSTIAFLLGDSVVPLANRRHVLISQGLDPNVEESTGLYQREGFWYRSEHLIFNVGRYDPANNFMEDLNVFKIGDGFSMTERIHAKSARFENGDWTLSEGHTIRYPADTHFPVLDTFKTLRGVIKEQPRDFKTMKIHEETMQLRELRKYISRNQASGLDTAAQQVHYHERIAVVFSPLILLLIALPYGLKPLRTASMAKSVSFCFVVVLFYLVMFRLSLSIGKGGNIPPLLAAWTPNALFVLIATTFLLRR